MAKKVRPAIFSGPLGWGWVNLNELAEILNLSPEEVVKQYGRMSKDADQYNVLAAVVEGKFGNYDIDLLAEMKLTGAFVPAGWATSVIDEATGQEKRRQTRIEEAARRIFAKLKAQGYSSHEYDDYGEDDEAEGILAKVQELAEAAGLTVATIRAEKNYTPADEPYGSYEVVFYDTSRFKNSSANYGQHLWEEKASLEKDGYFVVTADCVSPWGSVYYLLAL